MFVDSFGRIMEPLWKNDSQVNRQHCGKIDRKHDRKSNKKTGKKPEYGRKKKGMKK